MSVNHDDYPIRINNWLATEILYEGTGKAEFKNPSGYIEGPSRIEIDESGLLKVSLEIQTFNCEPFVEQQLSQFDTLMWLLNGRKPLIMGHIVSHDIDIKPNNTCISFQLSTNQGLLKAVGKILYDLPILVENQKIIFHLLSAVFERNLDKLAEYWVFPLNNFISSSLVSINFPLTRHILDKHPLRISPPAEVSMDLSPTEQKCAINYANRANYFIPFKTSKSLGFIEPLSDYRERAERLKNGEKDLLITSVMVGDVEKQPVKFSLDLNFLPLDYLHLLSLASGTLVGIPWIEFRDKNGDLVSRLHTQQWQGSFVQGHVVINNACTGGISWLLAKAKLDLEPEMRAAIRLIIKGSQPNNYLEDRLTFLFRAADTLSKNIRQNTRMSKKPEISDHLRSRIEKIIKDAAKQIREIAIEGHIDTDKDHIDRVAQVVSGSLNNSPRRPDEAHAIILLSEELGLMDFDVLVDTDEWIKLYNKCRNQVIHESYFSSEFTLQEYIPLWIHLQDLLIRIVLKQLNYDGEYRKFIPPREDSSVDWVDSNTPLEGLWYYPASK